MRRWILGPMGVVALACGSGEAPPPSAVEPGPEALAPVTEPPKAVEPSAAASDSPCAGRAPCRLVQVRAVSGGGRVVELALEEAPGSEDPGAVADPCVEREWWLLREGATPALLLKACNDGYGASGIGEDSVEISETVLSWSRVGGAGLRWTEGGVVGLAPLRWIERSKSAFRGPGAGEQSLTWRVEDFEGKGELSVLTCAEEGDESAGGGSFRVIPEVEVADPSGWATADLSACSSPIDAERGYVLGEGAPDAHLRVVALKGGVLLVDVADEPDADDAIELWFGPEQDPLGGCVDTAASAEGWRVPLAASPPVQLSDAARAIEVERAESGRRLRVVLPGDAARLSVVYRDGANPAGLGSSDLRGPEARWLGESYAAGACVVEAGAWRAVPPVGPAEGAWMGG